MTERRRSKPVNEESFRGDLAAEGDRRATLSEEKIAPQESAEESLAEERKELQRLKDARAERLGFYPHAEGVSPIVPESAHYRTPPSGQPAATERVSSMSMLDPTEWELEDSHEPFALRDGTEAKLRILEVQKGVDNEREYLTIRLEVPEEPYSKDITHWLNVPSRKMDAKHLNVARNDMLKFCQCFEIDRTRPFDPTEDWVGLEGWCILGLRKSEQYGEQNRIGKFIVPRS